MKTERWKINMNIQKVLNDGKITGSIIRFLTSKGYRTPKEIWIGYDSMGDVYSDTTKKGVIAHIERIERLRVSNPHLFNK